jgi:hypothetical protein
LKEYRRFAETCRLHLQGRKSLARNNHEVNSKQKNVVKQAELLLATCFHAGTNILLGLFEPEDGGDIFFRNFG